MQTPTGYKASVAQTENKTTVILLVGASHVAGPVLEVVELTPPFWGREVAGQWEPAGFWVIEKQGPAKLTQDRLTANGVSQRELAPSVLYLFGSQKTPWLPQPSIP